MIMSYLRIKVSLEEQQKVLDTLRYVNGAIRLQPGFINCRAYKDLKNSDALTIIEEWKSRKDLFGHIRSDEYRATLALMDMSSEPPELRFHSVSPLDDLALVSDVRGNGEDMRCR